MNRQPPSENLLMPLFWVPRQVHHQAGPRQPYGEVRIQGKGFQNPEVGQTQKTKEEGSRTSRTTRGQTSGKGSEKPLEIGISSGKPTESNELVVLPISPLRGAVQTEESRDKHHKVCSHKGNALKKMILLSQCW